MASQSVHPLHSTGGWAQLKFRPIAQFEVNGAMGQDENLGKDLRFFPSTNTDYGSTPLQKNRATFVNFIYKPRASLLFALEYRRLFTAPVSGVSASGNQINLAAGVHF